jgi:transcriptional regulator with XRE-family HTH domain
MAKRRLQALSPAPEQSVNVDDFGDKDDFDRWIEEESERDPRLAGAIADAECRANLLAYLIQCRQDKGLSQSIVAEAMETTQSAVSELEGGGTDPRLSTLQRFARALGSRLVVSVDTEVADGWHRTFETQQRMFDIVWLQHVPLQTGLTFTANEGAYVGLTYLPIHEYSWIVAPVAARDKDEEPPTALPEAVVA